MAEVDGARDPKSAGAAPGRARPRAARGGGSAPASDTARACRRHESSPSCSGKTASGLTGGAASSATITSIPARLQGRGDRIEFAQRPPRQSFAARPASVGCWKALLAAVSGLKPKAAGRTISTEAALCGSWGGIARNYNSTERRLECSLTALRALIIVAPAGPMNIRTWSVARRRQPGPGGGNSRDNAGLAHDGGSPCRFGLTEPLVRSPGRYPLWLCSRRRRRIRARRGPTW